MAEVIDRLLSAASDLLAGLQEYELEHPEVYMGERIMAARSDLRDCLDELEAAGDGS